MRTLLTLAVLAALSLFAAPAQAGLGRVVALGDSYATGTGLGTPIAGSPEICDRTAGGFPEVAMRKASHGELINQTCNGSTTQAFFYGSPGIPDQTAVLDGSERVVIVGIGGNNAQFGSVSANCLIHSADFDGNVCTNSYGSGAANTLPALVTAALTTDQGFAPSVGHTLDQIHAKSPLAKIFLVGYLRIAPPDGAACNTPFDATRARSYLNLTPTDAPVFAAWEDTMQSALESQAAGRSYVHFVDMQPASAAHHACNPASQRWVNSLPSITPDAVDGLNLHPSGAGAEAVSTALLNAMSAAGLSLGPDITISAPASGSYTTASTATVSYSATSSLGTPDCTPASGSSVNLNPGLNTITVTCSDSASNPASAEVTVSRGSVPTVAITAPSSGDSSTASSVNLAYSVDGSATIPSGTTCSVGEASSTDTQANSVPLALGPNAITVSCTNAYGAGSAIVSITREDIPVTVIDPPANPTPNPDPGPIEPPSPLTVSLSSVAPSRFSPMKSGSTFSRTSKKGGARIRVTLSAAASVRVRVEQLGSGKARSSWSEFALPAGISTLRLSGRSSKRALAAGQYRIRLAVRGTSATYFSRSFRILR